MSSRICLYITPGYKGEVEKSLKLWGRYWDKVCNATVTICRTQKEFEINYCPSGHFLVVWA